MANLIDELYPEDTHTRRMWLKYDEIDADSSKEDRDRILSEMKAMQLSDEKERGEESNFDASVFWGVLGNEHKDHEEWNEAEECFRAQLEFIHKCSDGTDSFSRANAVRAMSALLSTMGQNLEKTDVSHFDEMRKIWDTAYAIVDDGWEDGPLMDMDGLYWLVRRKGLFEAGVVSAIARGDEESALKLSHEFISHDADIPEEDEWCEIFSEILNLVLLELKLSEKSESMDELIDGIHWLDDNSKALLSYANDMDMSQIPSLVHFFALSGAVWHQMGNDEKADSLWTTGLEFSKEIYREGEELTFEGLKSHLELFRMLSNRHREAGRHKESYELELEIRKMLSQIKPHISDMDIIGERVSNGMFLGSYSEDLKEYDRMLSFWTEALSDLMDVYANSEWALNVFTVLSDHWKNSEKREYNPEKLASFEKALEDARVKFEE